MRRKAVLRSGLALFCLLLTISLPVYGQEPVKPKQSHFASAFESEIPLPPGTRLAVVNKFLKKRVVLRSDIPGGTPAEEEVISSSYVAEKIIPNTPILVSQTSASLPESLRYVVPPHKQLYTMLVSQTQAASASLCRPYDKIMLLATTGGRRQFEARLASFQLNDAPLPSILVLAVNGNEYKLIEKEPGLSVQCLRTEKYQE